MICANLKTIRDKIDRAAEKCGRNPDDIQLLAVSKRMNVATIEEAWHCGQRIFGENFIQEAREKITLLDPAAKWHFIGHLQSNKAKLAVELFDLIETVDRMKIAQALNRYAGELDRVVDILVQVNIGLEEQKSGVVPQKTEQFLKELGTLRNLRVRGLMIMPPYSANPEDSRPFFRKASKLAEQFRSKGLFADNSSVILSMGMSGDFTVAVEEGATLVRVGTAIFGERA